MSLELGMKASRPAACVVPICTGVCAGVPRLCFCGRGQFRQGNCFVWHARSGGQENPNCASLRKLSTIVCHQKIKYNTGQKRTFSTHTLTHARTRTPYPRTTPRAAISRATASRGGHTVGATCTDGQPRLSSSSRGDTRSAVR
jgi:hypothetical protein